MKNFVKELLSGRQTGVSDEAVEDLVTRGCALVDIYQSGENTKSVAIGSIEGTLIGLALFTGGYLLGAGMCTTNSLSPLKNVKKFVRQRRSSKAMSDTLYDRRRVYLGDGVFAEIYGFHIILTTEKGGKPSNRIFLDPAVVQNLERFIAELKQPRKKT